MFLLIGLSLIFSVIFLQSDGGGTPVPGVVPIIEGVAAATMTGYLVGFFKKAYPNTTDARIVGVAILAGLFSAVVASMVNGGVPLSQMGIGTIILQGIGAAAISAGVQGANKPPAPTPPPPTNGAAT